MHKTSIALAGLMAAAAFAQDGFQVGLQVASSQPLLEETSLGIRQNAAPDGFQSYNFAYDRQTPLTLNLGYTRGADTFSMEFMSTKKTSDQVVTGSGLVILLGGSAHSVPSLHGQSTLEAQILDLAWRRQFAKLGTTSFSWGMGLRYASLKHTSSQFMADDQVHYDTQAKDTAYGLSTSLGTRTDLGERFWLSTGLTLGFLQGTVKEDNQGVQAGTVVVAHRLDDDKRSLLQSDLNVRMNMNFAKGFDGYLGYEYRNFDRNSLSRNHDYITSTLMLFQDAKGFGLAGFTLGLSYHF